MGTYVYFTRISVLAGFRGFAERFRVEEGGLAGVIVFFPAPARIAMALVKADRGFIVHAYVQADGACARGAGRPFRAAEQLDADAAAAPLRMHFDGFDVGRRLSLPGFPLHDYEPGQVRALFGDPRGRLRIANNLAHVRPAETPRRLEAQLLDRVQGRKVGGGVEAVLHKETLQDGEGWLGSCYPTLSAMKPRKGWGTVLWSAAIIVPL